MDKLNQIVLDLVVNKGIKHNEILKTIHDTLSNASENYYHFLYCDSYGEFGYSKYFEKFIKENNGKLDRLKDYDYIYPFGLFCSIDYPNIVDKIKLYIQYDLGYIFDLIKNIKFLETKIDKINKHIQNIIILDQTFFGENNELSEHYEKDLEYYDDTTMLSLKLANKIAFLNLANRLKQKLQLYLQNEKQELFQRNFTDHQIDHMLQYYKKKSFPKTISTLSFKDIIDKYGENDPRIWYHQQYFNKKAMLYLQENPHVFFLEDDIDINTEIALLFASNTYCNLKIAKIPQLLDWTIYNHDGKETIIIL